MGRTLTIVDPAEGPRSRMADKTEVVEFDPGSAQADFGRTLDPQNIADRCGLEADEQVALWKPAISRQPEATGRNGLKDQLESPVDDGQFIAFHPPFEDCLCVGAPEDRDGAPSDFQGDDQ